MSTNFNFCSYLKIVLPRHLFLEELRKLSVAEDSCTLCFDMRASVKLIPCQHTGFCQKCTSLLLTCPICRAEIISVVEFEDLESTNNDFPTS